MSIRWTKRPQNHCRSCGYIWYPRGHNLSPRCPVCQSPEVELAIEALLRAIGYLLALPFILAALLIRWLIAGARWLARKGGVGAVELVEASAPARARAGDLAVRAAKKSWAGFVFAVHWLLSAKDDMVADDDRDVNPIGLLLKLVVIVALLTGAIILAIESVAAIRRA